MLRYCWLFYTVLLSACASAQGKVEEASPRGWPRETELDGHKVVAYQPQIDSWRYYGTLRGRMAVAVTPKGAERAHYGAVSLKASTEVDFENRTVAIHGVGVESVSFPNAEQVKLGSAEEVVRNVFGDRRVEVSLDRVLAAIELNKQQQRDTEVNLDPPPIFVSDTPSLLVVFLGEPQYQPIAGSDLLFATNTNWDVFLQKGTQNYYLLDGESWLTTKDLMKGPWQPTSKLPASLSKLPDDENWREVRERVPGRLAPRAPRVFVTNEPAELVVTDGKPKLEGIKGTGLMWVTNTESDLFLHLVDGNYYLLVAGRWFRNANLSGKWQAATRDLPADFAKIPADHPQSDVLASVPGTDAAKEAQIQASIPRTATVDRKQAKAEVIYDGEPKFEKIEGTSVAYAINTAFDVFLVDGRYYLCHQGIWFVAVKPTGPWVVCDSVPKALYTIPSTHPKHNVTYVYVYNSTPTTVVVGYTAGYVGCYHAYGLLMFGCGFWWGHYHHYHHYPHYHYRACWFGYGCGAYYSHYHGRYYRAHHCYGPHGGAGHGAVYNPRTGGWARGAYAYGPSGSRFAAEGYNPWTGRYGKTVQGSNGYRSWGKSVVATRDGYVRTGHVSGPRGTTRGFETSNGAAGLSRQGRGGSTRVIKDKNNNVYVGRNGDVYRRDPSGGWEKRHGDGWGDAKLGSRDNPGRPAGNRDVRSGLDRDARSRSRGTQRERSYRPTPSRSQPSGGSRTQPSGGSRTRPSGGSSSRPSGGSRTRPGSTNRTPSRTPRRTPSSRPGRSGRYGGSTGRRGSSGARRGGGGRRR